MLEPTNYETDYRSRLKLRSLVYVELASCR